jgi:hypothetical protein
LVDFKRKEEEMSFKSIITAAAAEDLPNGKR